MWIGVLFSKQDIQVFSEQEQKSLRRIRTLAEAFIFVRLLCGAY